MPETAGGSLSLAARDPLFELARTMDAVALGPGLSLDPESQELARALVRELDRPMVVDADALTALAGHLDLLRGAAGPRALTPHPGEMARLLADPGHIERVLAEGRERAQAIAAPVLRDAKAIVGLLEPRG